jgi:alkylation response protein AidB-like acyl-CoA dehydrogenase
MIRSLGLNESDVLVRETVLAGLADCVAAAAAGVDATEGAFRLLAELGVLAAPLAESEGGMGEGLGNAALVLEPLGRHGMATPFIETVCVPAAIAERYPACEPLRAALQSAAAGGRGAVVAWMEESRGWGRLPRSTQAERTGTGWSLTGVKPLVRWGDRADAFIVTAVVDGGPALFWMSADTDGVSLKHRRAADGRSLADVTLRNVVLPETARIDTGGCVDAIDYALDVGAALSTAEAVGLMDRALEMTVDYLKTRQQFGTQLSKMQALQHRLIDMYADVECAWSLAHDAACCLTGDVPSDWRQEIVSRAKAHIGRVGRLVAQEALQMHGAIGMTKEYPLGRCLQRLTALSMDYGDRDWHLDRQVKALQENRT